MYLLITYIKSVLWRVAKCLSYMEEARCLKVNYAINGACLRMVLLTDVYRNLTSLWIKPRERAFKQFNNPVLNVLTTVPPRRCGRQTEGLMCATGKHVWLKGVRRELCHFCAQLWALSAVCWTDAGSCVHVLPLIEWMTAVELLVRTDWRPELRWRQ